MNYSITRKIYIVLLVVGFLIAFSNKIGIQPVYAQTNLQELQNRVIELEKKLADAKIRQEKAYNVQMKLEEQEKKLASLAKSDEYKIQIIEIRADIKNIRTKIESIIKEKNDLEENLRLAKNLQGILQDAQVTTKPAIKTPTTPAQTRIPTEQRPVTTTVQPIVKTEGVSGKSTHWQLKNIRIDDHFNYDEHKEITSAFIIGHRFNQEDILNKTYQIYTNTGAILNLTVHSKNGDSADFDISFNQREARNSNYSSNSSLPFMTTIKPLNEFKKDHFQMTIKND